MKCQNRQTTLIISTSLDAWVAIRQCVYTHFFFFSFVSCFAHSSLPHIRRSQVCRQYAVHTRNIKQIDSIETPFKVGSEMVWNEMKRLSTRLVNKTNFCWLEDVIKITTQQVINSSILRMRLVCVFVVNNSHYWSSTSLTRRSQYKSFSSLLPY